MLYPLLRTFLLILCGCVGLVAPACAATPVGLWLTADKGGVIEIFPCEENSYCGRFYWLAGDSAQTPSLDDHNPSPELRDKPLCGQTFMGDFRDEGTGVFGGGWIYSIRHGAQFSADLKLVDDDVLELRGYVVVPWLGGSETWTRLATHERCQTDHFITR